MSSLQTNSGRAAPCVQPRVQPAFLRPGAPALLLFGGKGGVGKTTCATGTALRLADRAPERDYLLASTDPAHSLEDCLAGTAGPPNLWVCEIDAQESLRKFKDAHAEHLRQIAQRGTFLDDDDLGRLLDLSLPGLDELMAFIDLAALAESGDYAGIVVDTAPTGHTLRLLGLPNVLRQWLAALNAMLAKHRYLARVYRGGCPRDETDAFLEELAATIERLAALLADPQRCCFVPVMLAEPLVTEETVRLVQALERLNIPVQELVVNAVYPPGPTCPACDATRREQAGELRRICGTFPGYRLWSVPFQASNARGVPLLAKIWQGLRRVGPLALAGEDGDGGCLADLLDETPREPDRATAPCVEYPAPLPTAEMRLLFFAGKGGVGKTTLAAATALRLAQEFRDKQILLLSLDPAHSLSDCLGRPIGPQAVRLADRLSAIEIDAEAELAELKRQYVEEIGGLFDRLTASVSGLDVAFDREVVEHVMDLSPPGVDEVMALACVIQLLEAGEYDACVCDTAPTGHLIRLLERPTLVQQWLRAFFSLLLKYERV